MTFFQFRQLARNSYFRQLTLTSPVVFTLLKVLAARAAGAEPDPLTGLEAGVVGMWTLVTTATGVIGYQRFQGILQYQVLSPRRPATVFTPVVVAAVWLGLISVPIGVMCATVLGVGPHVRYPLIAMAAGVVIILACMVSAVAIAAICVLSRQALVYEQLLLTPFWLLSGVVVPWNRLPDFLRPIALISPLTGGVSMLRLSAAGGGQLIAAVSASVLACMGWYAVSRFALRTAVRRACVEGTLGL